QRNTPGTTEGSTEQWSPLQFESLSVMTLSARYASRMAPPNSGSSRASCIAAAYHLAPRGRRQLDLIEEGKRGEPEPDAASEDRRPEHRYGATPTSGDDA